MSEENAAQEAQDSGVSKGRLQGAAVVWNDQMAKEENDRDQDSIDAATSIFDAKEQELREKYPNQTIKERSFQHYLTKENGAELKNKKHEVTIICSSDDCNEERTVFTSDLHQTEHCEECKKKLRKTKGPKGPRSLKASYEALGLSAPDGSEDVEVTPDDTAIEEADLESQDFDDDDFDEIED